MCPGLERGKGEVVKRTTSMHSNPYYLPPCLPPLFQERRRRRGESEPDWVMAGGDDASASPSSDSSDIDDGEVKADVKADGEASKEVKFEVEVSSPIGSDGAKNLTSNAAAVVAVGAEGLTKNPLALRRDSDHSLEL